MCSKFVNHSRLNSQLYFFISLFFIGGGLCDLAMAPWPSPLEIHFNSERSPNFYVIKT